MRRLLATVAAVALLSWATPAHALSWRMSAVPFSQTAESSDRIWASAVSGNGRVVAYTFGNCGTSGLRVAYYDRTERVLRLVGSRSDGDTRDHAGMCTTGEPSLSRDGRLLAFASGSDFVAPPYDDPSTTPLGVFVVDTTTGRAAEVRLRISAFGHGARVVNAAISGDGRTIVVVSQGQEMISGRLMAGCYAYLVNLHPRTIRPVSAAADGWPRPVSCDGQPAIDATGRYVAFVTTEHLVSADDDAGANVYVRDTVHGTTQLAARHQTDGTTVDDARPVLSADGRTVAFVTSEHPPDKTADTDPYHPSGFIGGIVDIAEALGRGVVGDAQVSQIGVHVVDLRTGTVRLAPVAVGNQASTGAYPFDLSGDAKYVAFTTESTTAPADGSTRSSRNPGAYRWNVTTGAVDTVVETASPFGWPGAVSGGNTAGILGVSVSLPRISGDGSVVTFVTSAKMADDDHDGLRNVYTATAS